MIEQSTANKIADEWVSAWNNHIEAIMSHYAEDIVFTSPMIVRVNNDPSGTITNKADLQAYFTRALGLYPDLHFELYKVLTSVNSIMPYYKSINNLVAAELMELDEQGKIKAVNAHYAQ